MTLPYQVQLFDKSGVEKLLPGAVVTAFDFEISAKGGYQNGRVQILWTWTQTSVSLTDYVDIWLYGKRMYRGYVREMDVEIGVPERKTLHLFGLMDLFRGYWVDRKFVYPTPAGIADVFTDIVTQVAVNTGRMPNLQISTGSTYTTGITLQSFDATGKDLAQTLQDLCQIAPGAVQWGCDVDSAGRNRVLMYPRPTNVKYKPVIGKDVTGFAYPVDSTQIVNVLHVTGGKMDSTGTPPNPPNLLTNGSFEEPALPGELTANLLYNGGFETGENPPDGWTKIGDSTPDQVYTRNGGQSVKFDNNPSSPEGLWQEVNLAGGLTAIYCCAWGFGQPGGGGQKFFLKLETKDSSGTVILTQQSGDYQPPGTAIWARYDHAVFGAGAGTPAKVRLTLQSNSTSGNALNLDDVALWTDQRAAKGWFIGQNTAGAYWAALDWQNADAVPAAYDGRIKVKGTCVVPSGGYVEITSDRNNHVSISQQRTYEATAWVYVPTGGSAMQVSIGGRIYQSGTLKETSPGTPATITPGTWTQVRSQITTQKDRDSMDVFLRVHTSGTLYFDAAGLWEGYIPELYYPGDTFKAIRRVDDYPSALSAAAYGSRIQYGDCEKPFSNDNITNVNELDAFCAGTFNVLAVPTVQGQITWDTAGASNLMFLDGQVQVVNLANAPMPLDIAKIRYEGSGETLRITTEVGNNQRPTLSGLMRNVVAGTK